MTLADLASRSDNALILDHDNVAYSRLEETADGYVFSAGADHPLNIIVVAADRLEPLVFRFRNKTLTTLRLIILEEAIQPLRLAFELEEDASVKMTQAFLSHAKTPLKVTLTANLQDRAKLRIDDCILHEGRLELTDIYQLQGEGANIYHRTLQIGAGLDSTSRHQAVRHLAKSTVSELENYLIAVDGAKLKYDVEGAIAKGHSASACTQFNRGLIFGEHAEIEADPKLLIDEYDVIAAHGAAIGQVNEDELFYLQSRGLSESEAKRLIVSGYVGPLLDAVGDPDIAAGIATLIEAKIKGAGIV